jgi:hypothetical protein
MNFDRELPFQHEDNRIWLEDESGRVIASCDFPSEGGRLVNITHTFVDDSLRGHGIASRLMRETVETIRKSDRRALVTCSYAQSWFSSHTEYLFLLVSPEEAEEARHSI